METLPDKILQLIVGNLPKRDQLKWVLINHRWCNWIRQEYLFDKINLYTHDVVELEKLLSFFEGTSYGQNARHINIDGDTMPLDMLARTTTIFPNVECLSWNSPSYEMNNKELPDIIQRWRHIKKVENDYCGTVTRAILSLPSITAQLEAISFGYSIHNRGPETEPFFDEVTSDISSLQNAHRLQSLLLRDAHINHGVLVQLHQTIRNLKTLELKGLQNIEYVSFYSEEDIPIKVESLDHLSIDADLDIFNQCYYALGHYQQLYGVDLMKFISDTYVDLVSFECCSHILCTMEASPTYDTIHGYLCKAVSNWRNLKKYAFLSYPMDDRILRTMNSSNIRLQELKMYVDLNFPSSQDQYTRLLAHPKIVKNLNRLHVKQTGRADDANQALLHFLGILTHLDTLYLTDYGTDDKYSSVSLVVDVLNIVPQLRCLEGECSYETSSLYNSSLTVNQPTQLVRLKIDFIGDRCLVPQSVKKYNELMKNILSQCPLLEEFRTYIADSTEKKDTENEAMPFIFYFKGLSHIQEIEVTTRHDACFKITVQDQINVYYQRREKEDKHTTTSDSDNISIEISTNRGPVIITDYHSS